LHDGKWVWILPILLLAVACAWPSAAAAHGLVGRTDLPIPSWLFAWAAAIVLVVSFALLGALWTRPLLQDPPRRRLFGVPRALEPVAGAAGVLIFGVVVYAGLAGTPEVTQNLAPTFVYVLFWVGVPVLCVLLGDVFRPFNPWRAVARAVPGLAAARRPYPRRLGRWPAVAALLAFAWLELVFVHRSDPETLAWLALGYAAVQLAGMAVFGVDAWTERADGFSVYFALVARLAPLERRDGALWLRPPAAGTTGLDVVPGTVAVVCTVIGTTTFDGASNGSAWRNVEPHLQSFLGSLEAAATVGLLACVAIVAVFYRLGIAGMRTVSDRFAARDLAGRFAHTLVPIAFAYVLAHYFSLLAIQGQAIGYLVSDPLGTGANIFGTAHFQIDLNVFSSTTIWYVQVGALVVGHVAGLVLAHDRALATFPRPREAARSQYWMLVVMVGFTCLGLWLLSAVST
jgi:hypothetical protein